jgi:hypothetical protein
VETIYGERGGVRENRVPSLIALLIHMHTQLDRRRVPFHHSWQLSAGLLTGLRTVLDWLKRRGVAKMARVPIDHRLSLVRRERASL